MHTDLHSIGIIHIIMVMVSFFLIIVLSLIRKTNTANRILLFEIINIFFISVTVTFMVIGVSEREILERLWKVTYTTVILSSALHLHLAHTILGSSSKGRKRILYSTYALAAIFILLHLTYGLTHVADKGTDSHYHNVVNGKFSEIYFVYLLISIIYTATILFRAYRVMDARVRFQIMMIFLAFGAAFIGSLGSILPTIGYREFEFLTLGLVLFPVLLSYGVLRYQSHDVIDAILKALRLITSVVIGYGIVAGTVSMIFLRQYAHDMFSLPYVTIFSLATFIWFTIYRSDRVRRLFQPREKIALESAVKGFLHDTDPVDSVGELEDKMLSHFATWTEQEGFEIRDLANMQKNRALYEHFGREKAPLLRERSPEFFGIEKTDIRLAYPIYTEKGSPIGILLFAHKVSGSHYTQEDIDELAPIITKLALSLETLDHNLQLRMQVLDRTKELRKKNEELTYAYEELKEIDKNKDNFLAVASHELRTPMTIIMGYADMLQKGSFGALTQDQKNTGKKYMIALLSS